ncbi:hypothetical protein [Sphingobacterium zeae]|uniref:hypothetical protein n=1 Tax=Sphingobacterium zeae TaxID=1776859 RepID=UPI00361010C3
MKIFQKKCLTGILMLLLLLCQQLYAQQQRTVTGIVKDEKGTPLPDLSVLEKGVSKTTSGLMENLPKTEIGKSNLDFSSLGYVRQEKQLRDGDNTIQITMKRRWDGARMRSL